MLFFFMELHFSDHYRFLGTMCSIRNTHKDKRNKQPISDSFALMEIVGRFLLLQGSHGQVERRFLLLQRLLMPWGRIELLISFSRSEFLIVSAQFKQLHFSD